MKTIIILFLFVFATNIMAQDNKSVVQEISKVAADMKTMQCDFVQTKSIKLLGEKLVSNGTLHYQQSDKLRWEYTTPYKYTFVLNGSNVLIRKGERADKIDTNQSKVFKEIARIMMNTVVGKVLTDTKDFTTSIQSTSGEYIATLTPVRKDMKRMFKTIVLHFDRKQKMVVRVVLTEHNGDNTVIDLKNVKTNVKIPVDIFAV